MSLMQKLNFSRIQTKKMFRDDLKMGQLAPNGPLRVGTDAILVKRFESEKIFNKKKENSTGAFKELKPVIVCAQCVTLMPLYGVLGEDYTKLRYSLLSYKTTLSLLSIFSVCVVTVVKSALFIEKGLSYSTVGGLLFYFGNTLLMITFLRLAPEWKFIMKRWAEVEQLMNGLPQVEANKPIVIFLVYTITISFAEHILSILSTLSSPSFCLKSLQIYFETEYKHLFWFTEYAPWKGAVVSLINFIAVMAWNFTDLFITAVSMAVRSRFTQLNNELTSIRFKGMPIEYWKKIREIYNKLSLLAKLLDEKLSFMILITFANNLFFISLQLLHSLNPMDSAIDTIYFMLSFGHLMIRTCTLCFAAASVYENSKEPLSTLFAVPSSHYNIEIQRLITQVSFDTIALTGCKFFSITRTLMLTVAGTIITYEIVLVQFSALSNDETSSLKYSGMCSPNS